MLSRHKSVIAPWCCEWLPRTRLPSSYIVASDFAADVLEVGVNVTPVVPGDQVIFELLLAVPIRRWTASAKLLSSIPEGAVVPEASKPSRLIVPNGLPGEHRFTTWRDYVATMWDIAVDDLDATKRFQVSADMFHLGTAIFAQSAVSGHSLRRTPSIVARAGVDHIAMQLRLRGTQTGQVKGDTVMVMPGDICFFDALCTYTATSTDYEVISVTMPRGLFTSFLEDSMSPHALVLRGDTPLGSLLANHIVAVMKMALTLSAVDAIAAAAGTAALAAACCSPLLGSRSRLPAAAVPAVLLGIRNHIETYLGSADLTAEGIAKRFGLSRSALYRLFEPLGGVADYVRKRRLARAYADLGRTATAKVRPRISDVGSACGFESSAVFSRAFRREFGFTPRDMQFAAGQPFPVSGEEGSAIVLHDWLARLTQ